MEVPARRQRQHARHDPHVARVPARDRPVEAAIAIAGARRLPRLRLAGGLLLGAAFQYRLDPSVVPTALVVDGLRRLLDLPPLTSATSAAASAAPTRRASP